MIFGGSFGLGRSGGISFGALACALKFTGFFVIFRVSSRLGMSFLCGIVLSFRMIILCGQVFLSVTLCDLSQICSTANY